MTAPFDVRVALHRGQLLLSPKIKVRASHAELILAETFTDLCLKCMTIKLRVDAETTNRELEYKLVLIRNIDRIQLQSHGGKGARKSHNYEKKFTHERPPPSRHQPLPLRRRGFSRVPSHMRTLNRTAPHRITRGRMDRHEQGRFMPSQSEQLVTKGRAGNIY